MDINKTLGILGGVGTLATAFFVTKLAKLTDAPTDQDHVTYICLNQALVPDRTAYLIGDSNENPKPSMKRGLQLLETSGVDLIAIPCNTSHCFFDELTESVKVPIINMAETTVKRVTERDPNAKKIGVLATTGTVTTGLYQNLAEKYSLEAIVPDENDQKLIMKIIYDDVKAGNERDVDVEGFLSVADRLIAAGADAVIIACTELSVVKDIYGAAFDGYKFIDAMDVLAEEAILGVGKKLRG
jgi:aspartate racemase